MKVIASRAARIAHSRARRYFATPAGYFLESYNERTLAEAGIRERFVQDNHSFSIRNVVRGLHYQVRPQAKLVRVAVGEILDVTVDLRRSSPTFGTMVCHDSFGGEPAHVVDPRWFCARIPRPLGECSRAVQGHRFL